MQNSFWLGNRISDFLFRDFSAHTLQGFISMCIGLFALAVLYELLVVCQISLKQTSNIWGLWKSGLAQILPQNRKRFFSKLGQTLLFTVQVFVSYILMLSVMTYNAYFTGSIVIGGGIGYFLLADSVLEAKAFGACDNFSDNGSNHSPSSIRREHAEEILKSVAEEISGSVRGMGGDLIDGERELPKETFA